MMIHEYAPLEAEATVSKRDAKHTTAVSTRIARPSSMRTLVGRSTSDHAVRRSDTSHATMAMTMTTTAAGAALTTTATPPPSRSKRVRRFKSYSESGALLERIVPPVRARPHSAGDAEDMRRRVTISGVSKNSKGTWMFKVDVGSDEWNTYVIRRRFTDFKELHDGLQGYDSWCVLPDLPHHGIYSVFQIFVTPEKALNQRAERLQELLQSISTHPVLSAAAAFKKFIGKNPQSLELGYVSLSCYEAPTSENQLRLSASESSYTYERRLSS